MIATDVASRGIDVKDIRYVINFDFPKTLEDYVHRIGRTGRAGTTGTAITFIDQQNDSRIANKLIKLLRKAKQEVPLNCSKWIKVEVMVETQGMVAEEVAEAEAVATDAVGMVVMVEVSFGVKLEQTANHWAK